MSESGDPAECAARQLLWNTWVLECTSGSADCRSCDDETIRRPVDWYAPAVAGEAVEYEAGR